MCRETLCCEGGGGADWCVLCGGEVRCVMGLVCCENACGMLRVCVVCCGGVQIGVCCVMGSCVV